MMHTRTIRLPSSTRLDANGVSIVPNPDGSLTINALAGQDIIFNEPGDDVDIRVEGDTEQNLLFVDASTDRVGIGTATPIRRFSIDGASLPVCSVALNGTERFVFGVVSAVGNWFTGTAIDDAAVRSDGGALWVGSLGAQALRLLTNNATRIFIDSAGVVYLNDTANANMTLGLTLNQGANDNQLLAGKSSDVAHGLTSGGSVAAETDDFVSVQKFSALLGGLQLASFAEDPAGVQVAMSIDAFGGQAATAPSTTNENLVIIRAAEHDGLNALVNAPANSQIFGVQRRVAGAWNNAFIVDAEGDLFVDGSITITAFDDWDDVALVRAFDQERTPAQIIRSEWDDRVHYQRHDLQRAGVLSTPSDGGRAMVNVTQLQRLHNGAIWQLGTRLMELARQQARLEYQLERLEAGHA